jgi:hypothetical protein
MEPVHRHQLRGVIPAKAGISRSLGLPGRPFFRVYEETDLILRSRAQHRVLRFSKDEGWMHGTDSLPSFETPASRAPQDEVGFFTRSFAGIGTKP